MIVPVLLGLPESRAELHGVLPFWRRERRIDVVCGVYTFDELAVALSSDGRTVRCSPALKGRAALVSLHDKTWDAVVRCLAEGLGVEVRRPYEGKADYYLASRNDPVLEGARRSVVSSLYRSVRRRASLTLRKVPSMPDPGSVEYVREDKATTETVSRASRGSQESPEKVEDARAFQAAALTQGNRVALFSLALAARDLPPPDLDALGNSWQAATLDGLPSSVILPAASDLKAGAKTNCLLSGFTAIRSGSTLTLRPAMAFLAVGAFPERISPPVEAQFSLAPSSRANPVGIYDEPADPKATTRLLGEKFAARHREKVANTQEALGREEASRAVELPASYASYSLAVEAWARATRKDVVMELSPANDLRPGETSRVSSLRSILSDGGPWHVDARQGVLLITDSLGFVDASWSYPTPALIALERLRRKSGRAASLRALTPSEADAYYGGLASGAKSWTGRAVAAVGTFRGFDTASLDAGIAPYFSATRQASSSLAQAFALGRLPRRTPIGLKETGQVESIVALLRAVGLSPESLEPWYPSQVAGLQLSALESDSGLALALEPLKGCLPLDEPCGLTIERPRRPLQNGGGLER